MSGEDNQVVDVLGDKVSALSRLGFNPEECATLGTFLSIGPGSTLHSSEFNHTGTLTLGGVVVETHGGNYTVDPWRLRRLIERKRIECLEAAQSIIDFSGAVGYEQV